MNKRELSKVARPIATDEMFRLAERVDGNKYIATSKIIDVSGEKILLLNFFMRSQLVEKKNGAEFRTFISRDDYITQDLTTARVKWKMGSLKHMLGWWWWNTDSKGHDVIFAGDSDYVSAKYYMKNYMKGDSTNIWDAIRDFQDEVMDTRLKVRHKKETDKIDKKMKLVPPIPMGFEKWAHNVAMSDRRYLIYKAESKKKETTGYCTHCKKKMEIDIQIVRPRNKKRGKCPKCGEEVTFIPRGYFPTYQRDNKWVCLLQKVSVGIVARYFHVHQEIKRDENYREEFHVGELCRIFYQDTDPIELRKESYEWGVYKQHGACRWCPDQNKHNCASAVLYTENLPEELKDSVYRYSAIDIFQGMRGCNPIPVYRYMNEYPTNRCLEMFVKSGLTNIADAIVEGVAYGLDMDAKSPMDILKISKAYIHILRKINGTVGELKLLRQCEADMVFPQADIVQGFYERFGGNDELLGVINAHMSIKKYLRYMDKQQLMLPKKTEQTGCHMGMMSRWNYTKEERIRQKYKDLAKDWLDYISWCAQLKYNMKDEYVLLPPDFRKAHDRVMKEYQDYKDKLERQRLAEIERLMKKVLAETNNLTATELKTGKFMIVVPKSGEEIKEEGRTLHHCVGTYVERVARGETMILFIRRIEKPAEPFYTMEFRDGKVVQCRGKNNCVMTKEIQAFAMAFEKKMNPENNIRIKAKVG